MQGYVTYEILINLSREKSFDGYVEGDPLVFTYRGSIESLTVTSVKSLLEEIWERHNRDDRPDGKIGPSLSVGDVVKLIPHASVEQFHSPTSMFSDAKEPWVLVDPPVTAIERTRQWADCIKERSDA
jgi:hypothetical protein